MSTSTYAYVVLGISAGAAIAVGIAAWRAGGKMRDFSLVLASLTFSAPLIRVGYESGGLRGDFYGFALAQLVSGPVLLMAATLLISKHQRAATWSVTLVGSELLLVSALFGDWLRMVLSAGFVTWAWWWEHLCRPGGWCDDVMQPWFERHFVVSANLSAAFASLYPLLAIPAVQSAARDLVAAYGPSQLRVPMLSADGLLTAVVAMCGIAFAVAIAVKSRREKTFALTACLPIGIWGTVYCVLPSSYTLVGVALGLISGLISCATVLVEASPIRTAS